MIDDTALLPTPTDADCPLSAGDTLHKTVSFTRWDIETFARLTGDANPLHRREADANRFGQVIASGQQTAAMLMGWLATECGFRLVNGAPCELLFLNTNFAYKEPVFADQELLLSWRVSSAEWKSGLKAWLVQLDGHAKREGSEAPSVVARSTLSLRPNLAGNAASAAAA
jgi:acyl dehydratase